MILRWVKIVGALVVLVLAWLLAFGNNQAISLAFMGWRTPTLPLFVWLIATLFAGLLVGLVLGRFSKRRRTER